MTHSPRKAYAYAVAPNFGEEPVYLSMAVIIAIGRQCRRLDALRCPP